MDGWIDRIRLPTTSFYVLFSLYPSPSPSLPFPLHIFSLPPSSPLSYFPILSTPLQLQLLLRNPTIRTLIMTTTIARRILDPADRCRSSTLTTDHTRMSFDSWSVRGWRVGRGWDWSWSCWGVHGYLSIYFFPLVVGAIWSWSWCLIWIGFE